VILLLKPKARRQLDDSHTPCLGRSSLAAEIDACLDSGDAGEQVDVFLHSGRHFDSPVDRQAQARRDPNESIRVANRKYKSCFRNFREYELRQITPRLG